MRTTHSRTTLTVSCSHDNRQLLQGQHKPKHQTLPKFVTIFIQLSHSNQKANLMYEAGSEQINCNGAVIQLPSLEVVKTVPNMPTDANIDWLLHIYFTRREFGRCRRLIERELNCHLNAEYLYFAKGLIEREDDNHIEALRNLQKAAQFNSRNIETFKEIGRTLYKIGRFEQALNVFRSAEQQSTRKDHEVYYYLGELLYRASTTQKKIELANQQKVEARCYFEVAVQTGKKQKSYIRLAELYRKEKDYQKAIEVLEACLQLTPESADVLTEIGVLYLKINETQKAYDCLKDVAKIECNCAPKGLLALGAILQSRNDVDSALSKYRQIANEEPEIAELWNNIGLCFFKKQKFIVAVSSLRKSIWLSPLNYNALYNLSLVYIASKQYANAFHTLAAAINLRKDNVESYMLLGLCLRKLNDLENAFVSLERACCMANTQQHGDSQQCSKRHPLVYLNFALFCYEIGRLALATEQYNRFLSHAQDLLLPTEFKFQATKLKSLLCISTTIRSNLEDEEDSAQADAIRGVEPIHMADMQEVLPLEVNAVVSES